MLWKENLWRVWRQSGNHKCPFCNSDRGGKTDEEDNEEILKRVAVNDPSSICMLANYYQVGNAGFSQDHVKAIELFTRAGELGCNMAHCNLGDIYRKGGYLKKAKFHFEAAAMAGHEGARHNVGIMEHDAGNIERAIKHWTIAASTGYFGSMHAMRTLFDQGLASSESIDLTLAAYNNSCVEMRSEARDAYIRDKMEIE
jgi:TPR repeat protein